jgi:hypothetical protein
MGCAVQSVDYGFGDNTKFTGSITPGGPGIGMVGSMSSTTPYANRLEVDTCEIDSFGMTPGLGAELAKSGAWSPIKGSPVSEKLAAEIGYKGNYSNVGNTAMVGSIKQAYERANKSQIQTQTKVNSIWTEGVSQAANNQAQIGQVVGGIMVQSASFGSNIQNNATNLWGSTVNSSAANHAAQSALAGQNILASATMGGNSINIAGNNLGSILASGSSGIGNAASTLTTATGGLTGSIGALQGLFDSQTSQFGTLLGSLNATALGLTTMGQSMGIPYGGAFVPAGGSSSGSNWGGTSISGAGGWVGSGSTMVGGRGYTTWGGTAASNAMSSVSAGSTVSWGGVTATRSSVSPSYWSSVISKRASGGMVNKPEVALIGEAGREAVLPNKLVETIMRGVDGGGSQMLHATINVDGRKLADVVGPAVVKRIQQGTGLKVR